MMTFAVHDAGPRGTGTLNCRPVQPGIFTVGLMGIGSTLGYLFPLAKGAAEPLASAPRSD
jgi:hypothetical protein